MYKIVFAVVNQDGKVLYWSVNRGAAERRMDVKSYDPLWANCQIEIIPFPRPREED